MVNCFYVLLRGYEAAPIIANSRAQNQIRMLQEVEQ